jgi:hypothetical protein
MESDDKASVVLIFLQIIREDTYVGTVKLEMKLMY